MIDLPRDENRSLSRFIWPGGYPLFYLDMDNSVLCPDCARESDEDPEEYENYKPIGYGINWENPNLSCDACGRDIEAAYVDPITGKALEAI